MDIAVVGSPEFTLGFQLAGISTLYNPEGEEETSKVFRSLLTTKGVGIVVVDSAVLSPYLIVYVKDFQKASLQQF
jgi:V/A-type H+-transporting ATPase subunit F